MPKVSTMDEGSKKIKDIVEKYWSGEEELFLPSNPELEDEFDDIVESVHAKLLPASPQIVSRLHGLVRIKYRRYYNPGVRPAALPPISPTAQDLFDFIVRSLAKFELRQ